MFYLYLREHINCLYYKMSTLYVLRFSKGFISFVWVFLICCPKNATMRQFPHVHVFCVVLWCNVKFAPAPFSCLRWLVSNLQPAQILHSPFGVKPSWKLLIAPCWSGVLLQICRASFRDFFNPHVWVDMASIFVFCSYGGCELSKHVSKCLRMWKKQTKNPI